MLYLFIKAALSGVIIMAVSEIARRSPSLGALLASLPLISVLGIMWLWKDTGNTDRIAAHSLSTFWFVLPSLPMFLVLSALLKNGISFWISLLLSCLLTIILYLLTSWLVSKFGIKI